MKTQRLIEPPPAVELDALSAIASDVLNRARLAGAAQAEVSLSVSQGLSVTVRHGEVETLEFTRDRGLNLTVYVDGRKGSASTADLADASIATTLEQALAIARYHLAARHAADPDCGAHIRKPLQQKIQQRWPVPVRQPDIAGAHAIAHREWGGQG